MLGGALPTPFYVIYQQRWGFSSGVITLVFAAYAAGTLTALLFGGRLSDEIGRRPVLALAVGFGAASSLAFIFATGVPWLVAGRILSGVSAGLVTGTGSATLRELAGPSLMRRASVVATICTTAGIGLGPLLAGVLADRASNPTVLAFVVHIAFLALAAIGLAIVIETVASRARPVLRFQGLHIPASARREFIAAGTASFASIAVLGLFTALAPSFLRSVLDVESHTVRGSVVFLAFLVSSLAQIVSGRYRDISATRAGLFALIVAAGLLVWALQQESLMFFVIATVVTGAGVGATFFGTLSTSGRLAPPDKRGQVMSTYFTFMYLGLTVPVIAVGFAADAIGFLGAVAYCAVGVGILCVVALVLGRIPGPREVEGSTPRTS